jgi:hypothetical protein
VVLLFLFMVVALFAAWWSVAAVIHDVRALHRREQSLSDAPMSAAGVSAAGMVWAANSMVH